MAQERKRDELINYLQNSYTCYHAIENAINILKKEGFTELNEQDVWNIEPNGKYFVVKDGSALIAFRMSDFENFSFNIVASHSDSPCLKIKYNPEIQAENVVKLNTEVYGGPLLYSFFDRKLTVAGRRVLVNNKTGEVKSELFKSKSNVVIPSLAIHMNREANKGFNINPQVEMLPLVEHGKKGGFVEEITACHEDYKICDFDLFACSDDQAFLVGNYLTAPRIDNLSSVFSGIEALINAQPKSIAMAVSFDNEEVGSRTKQGAGGRFLRDTIKRISYAMGKNEHEFMQALANSFIVSVDNAHATHPNHPEKNDPTNKTLMNGGIVIKHHANQNYTTDAVSSAIIKHIFDINQVKYQDFFMRADLPCGGTLGAISSSQLSIRSVDIGLAQLAMHSAMETVGTYDIDYMLKGLTAFFSKKITSLNYKSVNVK